MIKKFYTNILFKNPKKILFLVFLSIAFLGFYATKLEIDASAETLLLDDDKDLAFAREVSKNYKSEDILVITFTPKDKDLLSNNNLKTIKDLSEDILKLNKTQSIISILNVPLFQSPTAQLQKLVEEVKTLENSKDINKALVKNEFLTSAIYKNSLVSNDFETTAIIINLKRNEQFFTLVEKRNDLLSKKREKNISKDELKELEKVTLEFKEYRDKQRILEHNYIKNIRVILKKYKNEGVLFLGGVNMIATDIISFVKSDLVIYGSTLILLLIGILWVIFRQIRWVALSVLICSLSVIATSGMLGFFNWEVTVISSNFISLQLIITISIVLHLIVRYRELTITYKNSSHSKIILNTMLSKLNPSFFAIITTIAGFGSLLLSNIQPVINLGWMMSTGIAISLIIAFIVFPTILILLNKVLPYKTFENNLHFIDYAIKIVTSKGNTILIGSIILIAFALTGASKLLVENSFISYFKKDTEIYKSMKVIDQKLGGTTPLDIIINFNETKKEENSKKTSSDDILASFEDEFNQTENNEQYWFTEHRMNMIIKVHDYLESIPQVGKVQSLATMLKVGKILNNNEELDSFKLALLYNKLPNEYKAIVLDPYINIQKDQARITLRIIDSDDNLRRDELLKKINYDLKNVINDNSVEYRLSNLMVLYNNMLQSLFDSQVKTLGFVILTLFIMFIILFRSLMLATIAILANIVPISIIFGIMGWLEIPLDIMTITIAAISIGIGVDDTIHYIHRFKTEFKKDHNYIEAMKRSHKTIGFAMVYTSVAVMVGFSILVLSNLIPTIYFGLLTVIVMATILLSAILLLPRLIILFEPFSK
ncbi:efflux RND transporter permease subunit [Malaciobacter mytili]|uniref:efflux RND transporter permease subunit n=1 Tax=Malaciobacter mytili TaxID=603050 RepID=UPI003A83F6F5